LIINLKGIEKVLPKTDLLINTLPLNANTKGVLLNKTNSIKKGAIIINLSRKGIINEKEIIKKVNEKYFFGAIFDVYPKNIPLLKSNPRILFSHPILQGFMEMH